MLTTLCRFAQPPARPADDIDHLANLRRLLQARWSVLVIMAALALLLPPTLDIPLSPLPLLAVLAVTALCNALMQGHYRTARRASASDLLRQLLFDMASLSALIFFSGGATNPLVSLLLPSVAIAALTLPGRHVAIVVAGSISAYSALLLFYLPLPLTDPIRATRLHLTGMWLIFAVSAIMMAWFILHMTQRIRQRDAELAAAREQGLRAERVLAIGTLAAGAAHELGTPLASMLLLAGELAREPDLPASAQEDLALLRQQIQHCKEIITGLSQRAGAERLENTPIQAVDRWMDQIRQRWHASRPHTQTRLNCSGQLPVARVLADPRLEQALFNLLNNAANAAAQEDSPITIDIDWDAEHILLELRDQGPGFPPEVLEHGGKIRFPPHARGQGIGLLLTHSAIEQLGGTITLDNAVDGGAIARLTLPRLAP